MPAHPPIGVHPDNPRYFLFRGRPRALICATEHYGAVLNRAFDYERYLAEAAEQRQTLTRLFLLFRELQTARNPASPCKPESPDYLAPWARTGPGVALDGEPKYDLDRWDETYFARLRRFLTRAAERDIVVEVTLFSNTYAEQIWALNPLRADNNVNGVGEVEWQDYTSLRDPALVERQRAYVERVVGELNAFDNIYYEVCNEPGGDHDGHASPTEINAWQTMIATLVRDTETRLPHRHLIFWSEAFRYHPAFEQPLDASFGNPLFDAVNVHPLPDPILNGRRYMLGRFMGKETKLGEVRDFCLATGRSPQPCVLDEDNAASLYRDEVGWTIHRKRAWTAVLSGCHYDFIDFSIGVGQEAGTAASRRMIRAWLRHLSAFIHAFDVVAARPDTGWLRVEDAAVTVTGLAVPSRSYAAYIADGREIDEPDAGAPRGGAVRLTLPPGAYGAALYSPVSGLRSPAIGVAGGGPATVELPPFEHDVVLVVERRGS
jgi:hypothetical protein